MMWFLSASGLYLHVYFWGAAFAVLLLPRRLERLWPGVAPFAGLALQSAVVWAADFLPLRGTNAYAWPALALPLGLAGAILWRRRSLMRFAREAFAWWPVAVVQAALLVLLLSPLARAKLPLTSASLGSCDAADYAAGARVFQEFEPEDRAGFLGQAEVVGSVHGFHEYFVRLNHFTPSALMAINASVLDLRAHQIALLFTAVLPVFMMPVVFVGARALFRFRAGGALAFAAALSAGPLVTYAVYHVSPAQMLATMGVVVLTWAGVRLFEETRSWRGVLRWLGLGVAAVWLLAGSYNFILLVAFVPAFAWVLARSLIERAPMRVVRWLAWAITVVIVVAAFAPARFAGLAERFDLFEQYAFGWAIPALRPDGWLGAVGDNTLGPAHGWLQVGGIVLLIGALLGFVWRGGWHRRPALVLVALAAPILAGYAFLLWQEARRHDNSSYDAYKLLSVFLPLIVGALCPWLRFGPREPKAVRVIAVFLAAVLVAVNLHATTGFRVAMRQPPLVVDRELAGLARIESLDAVDGVNMRIPFFWSRLWANSFLLHKRQFFPTDTYETRWHSPLRANFDLRDALIRLRGPADERPVFESRDYIVVDRRVPWFVDATFDGHWFEPEKFLGDNWRWSEAQPVIVLRNTHARPLRASVAVDLRAAEAREIFLTVRGREIWRGPVGLARTTFASVVFELAPGDNDLVFDSPTPATPAPGGDPRRLLVALFGMTINVQPAPEPASAPTP